MSRLLDALYKKNRGRPPVWMMRQAGRYLPEYRELRSRYSLRELFFTPELAVRVTKMPIDRFGFDAAILFSDITVVALALGLHLDFQEGPKITPEVTPQNVAALSFFPEKLSPIFQTIGILKKDLLVPLLGFCGAPFTVASYLIGSLEETTSWMRTDPFSFQILIDKITHITSLYLQMQEKSGVDAVQIFDSWANVLTPEEFRKWSLEPLKNLRSSVSVPVLFLCANVALILRKSLAGSVLIGQCVQKRQEGEQIRFFKGISILICYSSL